MRLKDVPKHPAYLVFHDAFDNGAMDIFGYENKWPESAIEITRKLADECNTRIEEMGNDDCGRWAAYEKLPRVRVYKYGNAFYQFNWRTTPWRTSIAAVKSRT